MTEQIVFQRQQKNKKIADIISDHSNIKKMILCQENLMHLFNFKASPYCST
jgi:hypothetical protein